MTGRPVISVVVCSYNSRSRIGGALDSLRAQDLDEPYEVIVVDSGTDGCAAYLAESYPEVRLVRSERRLRPGPARNAGVRAARGDYVAFLPDDGIAEPDWLRRRLAKHREGFAAVGGAITNGTPLHPVGSADYYIAYSALLPSERSLAEQQIPHCLSYERALFDKLGSFPDDTGTGEDTLFNERCVAAGVSIGFEPGARLAHRNLTGLIPFVRHHVEHGRGMVRCGRFLATTRALGRLSAARYVFLTYPTRSWRASLARVRRARPAAAPWYLALTPVVWAGLWATALGVWAELGSTEEASRS